MPLGKQLGGRCREVLGGSARLLGLRRTKARQRDGNWRSNYDLYQAPALIADQESSRPWRDETHGVLYR
jgi:hypothetical protein